MAEVQGKRGPKVPVPPPIRSDKPGTWAYRTMSDRIRTDILARVFRENNFSPSVLEELRKLDKELENAESTRLTPIPADGGPDVDHWNQVCLSSALQAGDTWLSAPWAVSEFYFYRRIMSAIAYFKEPVDPFASQKELGLLSASASIDMLASRANEGTMARADIPGTLQRFLYTSLWGNRSTSCAALYFASGFVSGPPGAACSP